MTVIRIEILETREYRPFGLRYVGEQVYVDEQLGRQLIGQGFAREVIKQVERKEIKYGSNRKASRNYAGGE